MINALNTTGTFSDKYVIFQINHKSCFSLVKDDRKQTIQVSSIV